MPTYLLPCACGRKLPVTVSQAGLSVSCECGASLEVPGTRGLATLEREAATQPALKAAPSRRRWGPRAGGLFLGIVLTLAALGASWALVALPVSDPTADAIRQASLADSVQAWLLLRERSNIRLGLNEENKQLKRTIEQRRLWSKVSLGVAGLGVVIFLGSFALPKDRKLVS